MNLRWLLFLFIALGSCKSAHERNPANDVYDNWVKGLESLELNQDDFKRLEPSYRPKTLNEIEKLKLPSGNSLNREFILEIEKHFNPRNQKSSGGWGGTGGSGVVCFESERVANRAVTRKGVLKESYYDQIKRISLLDYFEAPQKENFYPVKSGETVKEYLERTLERLDPLAPYFTFQLRLALKMLLTESWVDREDMPYVPDIGTQYELADKSCRRVQFAIRFSKSTKCDFPDVFLHVNHRLLKKVRELNTPEKAVMGHAMFLLHEALYLLGVEIGHKNSSDIRSFVRFFLDEQSAQFRQQLNELSPGGNLAEGFLYSFHFFNFISYRGLFLGNGPIESFSNQSRRRSYAFTTHKIEEQANSINRRRFKGFDAYMAQVVRLREKYRDESFTDEDAFLMKAFAYFQQNKLKQHFDYLLIGEEEDKAFIQDICQEVYNEVLRPFLGYRPPSLVRLWQLQGITKTKEELIADAYAMDKLFSSEKSYPKGIRHSLRSVRYCSHYLPMTQDEWRVFEEFSSKYSPREYPMVKRFEEMSCR